MALQKNFELFGNRVIIKVHSKDREETESGLVVPRFENYETPGGRPAVKAAEDTRLLKGTVELISKNALELLEKENSSLKEGDVVLLSPAALNPSYYFFVDRDSLNPSHYNYICIPYSLIEGKYEKVQ